MSRVITIALLLILRQTGPALDETLRCSQWNDLTTCTGPGGYISHENRWNDMTFGDDNQGNRWTTSRWRDTETTEFNHR